MFKNLDLGLAVMDTVTFRGKCWSHEEIADICGCSKFLIWTIEQRALRKLRRLLLRLQKDQIANGEEGSSGQDDLLDKLRAGIRLRQGHGGQGMNKMENFRRRSRSDRPTEHAARRPGARTRQLKT